MAKIVLASSKRLRRRRIARRLLLWIAALAFFAAGGAGFFYIPVFQIKSVSVEGLSAISEEEMMSEINSSLAKKYFAIIPFRNILVFPKNMAISDIQRKFPRVRDILIYRDFFTRHVNFTFEERTMAAIWCVSVDREKNDCALMDKEGVIFSEAPSFSGTTLFKIYDGRENNFLLGDSVFPADFAESIFNFRQRAKNELDADFHSFFARQDGVFEFVSAGDWRVVLDGNTDFNGAFSNLKIAFESSIQESGKAVDYIDLRFGNRVFYKFK